MKAIASARRASASCGFAATARSAAATQASTPPPRVPAVSPQRRRDTEEATEVVGWGLWLLRGGVPATATVRPMAAVDAANASQALYLVSESSVFILFDPSLCLCVSVVK